MRPIFRLLLSAFTILALASGPAASAPETPLNPDTYFGINGIGFFHRPDDKDQIDRRLALIRELGVKWDRSDFWWSRLEPRPGEWDFSLADRAMELYRAHGIQIFPILNYGAAWRDTQGPMDDRQRAEWAEYVTRVVGRYKGYADHWEVWNEPNIIPFWRPQPDAAAYRRLLEVTSERARAVNPAVRLVGFSLAGADHEFLERALAQGGAGGFDIFSYHYYRTARPEQATPEEIAGLRLILRHFGRECPIWVTEQGVTSNLREGVSEELQAVYWMREILLQIGAGVERVFPFTLVDNVSDPGGPWGAELGMVTLDWRKKPVFHAYKTLIAELNDYGLAGPVDLGGGSDLHALLFERRPGAPGQGPRHKLAVWSAGDARDIRVAIDDIPTTLGADSKTRALAPVPPKLTTYTALLGERRAVELDGATQRVAVSPAPLYLPVRNRLLEENARTRFEPGEMLASPGHTVEAHLAVALGEARLDGIRYAFPDGWKAETRDTGRLIEGAEPAGHAPVRQMVRVAVTVTPRALPGWYSVQASIPTRSGTVEKALRLWVRPEIEARVRPHAVRESDTVVTSFTVLNRNLASDTLWRFEAEPPLTGVGALAHGSLRAAVPGSETPPAYMAETALRLPRAVFNQIRTPTTIFLKTMTQTAAGTQEKRHPVYRIATIPLQTSPPYLDGQWTEYGGRNLMVLGTPEQELHSDWRKPWGGERDSSAVVSAVWTAEGLYIGARIQDDHPAMNDRGVGGDVYKGDGLEVYLGTRGYSGQYYAKKEEGFYHFAITPGRGGADAAVSDFEKEVPGSRVVVRVESESYTMEAFIPRDAFGGFVPQDNDLVPFDLQLNDRDDYSAEAKTSSLMWNGDHMNWLRADKWGLAVIQSSGRLFGQ